MRRRIKKTTYITLKNTIYVIIKSVRKQQRTFEAKKKYRHTEAGKNNTKRKTRRKRCSKDCLSAPKISFKLKLFSINHINNKNNNNKKSVLRNLLHNRLPVIDLIAASIATKLHYNVCISVDRQIPEKYQWQYECRANEKKSTLHKFAEMLFIKFRCFGKWLR